MKTKVWNPDEYARNARYVSDLGMPVLELLNPRPGELIPRPTPLLGGMRGFLETFADSIASLVAPDRREEYLSAVCERLEPPLTRNGEWIADYVRLRFEAFKG